VTYTKPTPTRTGCSVLQVKIEMCVSISFHADKGWSQPFVLRPSVTLYKEVPPEVIVLKPPINNSSTRSRSHSPTFISMSEQAGYTIKVQAWRKLQPSEGPPQREGDEAFAITQYSVDRTADHPIPIGDMTYNIPIRNTTYDPNGDASLCEVRYQTLTYKSERGENCSIFFEGDPRERGGTQSYTQSYTPSYKQDGCKKQDGSAKQFVSLIHFDFGESIEWDQWSKKSERTGIKQGTSDVTIMKGTSGERDSKKSGPKRLVTSASPSDSRMMESHTAKSLTDNREYWRGFTEEFRKGYKSSAGGQGLNT